ncbi:Hypothetical predicted protein [Pelobates cultripes]|uniref:Uncharacterized protein n=1 Tax=Pelobates cultripes TaxID=61616 RepID=A0AAD1TPQ5_PELCU|nr:Hypothetical predicted protein [Pelobates cultripes]
MGSPKSSHTLTSMEDTAPFLTALGLAQLPDTARQSAFTSTSTWDPAHATTFIPRRGKERTADPGTSTSEDPT